MADRRAVRWRNESNLLTPAADAQEEAGISTGVFDKGTTLTRILMELAITPVTTNTNADIWIAIWVGAFGGIPADISADSDDSYLYWSRVVMRVPSATGPDWFQYRTLDLRGQRVARSDRENIHLVVHAGAASAFNVFATTRVLLKLP